MVLPGVQQMADTRCQAPFLGLGGWEQLRAKAHGKATPRRGCQGRAFCNLLIRSWWCSFSYLCKQPSLQAKKGFSCVAITETNISHIICSGGTNIQISVKVVFRRSQCHMFDFVVPGHSCVFQRCVTHMYWRLP